MSGQTMGWRCACCGQDNDVYHTYCGVCAFLRAAMPAATVPSHYLAPAPKLPEPPKPPRVTGKVLGFRCWTLAGYNLHSAIVDASWKIGENKARCLRGSPFGLPPHDAPHPRCECGLYAFHELQVTGPGALYGAILAWGRIEVHADGFRAQYAEPVVLAYSREQTYGEVQDARTIAGEMGVPFVELSELEARARELGSPIAPELRPPATPRLSSGYLTPASFAAASVGAPLLVATPAYGWATGGIVKPPTPTAPPRVRRINRFIALGSGATAGANLASFIFDGQHLVSLIVGLLNAAIAVGFARRAARS